MTLRSMVGRLALDEDLNFLLTNRIPRRLATRLVGWLSKIEQPLVAQGSIAVWRLFSDVDLSDAATTRFRSMHDCFTRSLRPGARIADPDPDVLASPCDAIVGAHGPIEGCEILQVKGFPYRLAELLGDDAAAAPFLGGRYVTLRLTAGMYHHFHAPHDLSVERVDYISGDCWNVNPIALKRVERLFCRNERAAVLTRLDDGTPLMLVAVAAVLVASIRLTFLDTEQTVRERGSFSANPAARLAKGADMGWFEHGSTIVMLAPPGWAFDDAIIEGQRIRAGAALMRRQPACA
ncbi:archaetidylserine decarboxylase [Sphingomonas nostoxanthinifaciens]|uniref:archaetidylserine decarboxylase n=1 Tax=Sphingomonas nostoxanthinifaciens TaxID=2872652 RepID=UPI001CC1CAF0|nr:archaetidylserine decarboxylase [Sphingomonas nostoxanthinifaciens]UAK25079.1 archaetidylserine decarboxylase [Sphingomonas nostoxanthinifaciens]